MPPRRHVTAVLAVLLALGACASDDGRQLPPAGPDQTRSILTTSTAVPTSTDPALAQEVGSGAVTTSPTAELALVLPWQDDDVIDARYTCAGENVSPAVSWSNVPEGTIEIALVMTDPDASSFVHWVVAGLDPATGGIPESAVPETAIQAVNDFGDVGYGGPCPPETHTYVVDIYAVGQQLELGNGGPAADLVTAIESAAISTRSLAGRYP
ncbi:MAG: YbhB/YbcL family Raf kinase inhibitor-like protein [Acidimicrobiia bacterium]